MYIRLIHAHKSMQNGMTLMELLIGIALSSLIFLAASTLILILFTSNIRSKQLDDLEQTKNDIQQELSNVVKWGTEVAVDEANDLLEVDGTTYKRSGNAFVKNDIPINSSQIAVTNFAIQDHTNRDGYPSLELTFNLEHARFSTIKDTMRVIVSQRFGAITE